MFESNNRHATIHLSANQQVLTCSGAWTLNQLSALESQLPAIMSQTARTAVIDVSGIRALDTAGALFFQHVVGKLRSLGKTITVTGVRSQLQSLLDLVSAEHRMIHQGAPPQYAPSVFYQIGVWFIAKCLVFSHLLSFTGEVMARLGQTFTRARRLQWPLIFRVVNDAGCAALPIVALLTFLIGIILTYQIAIELDIYNANIFIVDITGMVILREFAPLMTAIIAAGRTSTAFTAEIGTMIVNEEVDALQTMGISPIERLVLPKVWALLIALPLVTVWADVFGILGSMLMSRYEMDVAYHAYLSRFQDVIAVRHYMVGLIKAPVFALIIVTVGCFQGFSTERTADSVGQKTMQSAVQSIFLIIIVDALFSILFSWRGI